MPDIPEGPERGRLCRVPNGTRRPLQNFQLATCNRKNVMGSPLAQNGACDWTWQANRKSIPAHRLLGLKFERK